jgi:hypothetical protein
VAIVMFLRKTTEKQNRIILVVAGGTMLVFETLKLLVMSEGRGWQFEWAHFPFVPCSIFMFLIFASAFMKGNLRQWVYVYLAFYGLFAGLSAFIVPTSVYNTGYWLVLFQTMLHHGLQVLVGVYLISSKRVSLSYKDWKNQLGAVGVFGFFIAVAIVLALVGGQYRADMGFNPMFISPFKENNLPLVELIANQVPYAVWVVLYIILFSVFAYVIFWLANGINKLVLLICTKVCKGRYCLCCCKKETKEEIEVQETKEVVEKNERKSKKERA